MRKTITNFVLKLIHKRKAEWEGSTIRSSRLRKFKKRSKGISIAAQVIAIWYLFIFAGSYLTSNTGAYFNDIETIENFIHVSWDNDEPPDGDEWDKSSLDMDGSEAWAEGCEVFTTIRNSGDEANTESIWRFYIYETSNLETPVAEGIVPKIQSEGTGLISSAVTENGDYKIRVRRPLGHPGGNNPDENGYTYLGWSDSISVTSCSEPTEQGENPVQADDTSSQDEDENENSTVPSDQEGSESEDDGETEPESESETPETTETEGNLADLTPPADVSGLKWARAGKSPNVNLSWSNPGDADLEKILIYEVTDGRLKLLADLNDVKATIELDPLKIHQIKVTTIDISGNESNGILIEIKPIKK